MEETFFDLADFLKKPSVTETFVDILLCAVPIWLAVMIGLVIGWSWRPRWTSLIYLGLRTKFRFLLTAVAPPGFGARRLWLAFTALSAFSACRAIWSNFRSNDKKLISASKVEEKEKVCVEKSGDVVSVGTGNFWGGSTAVTEDDLDHLLHLLERKVGEMEWQSIMEKSTPNMSYLAWRHEPKTGPIILRSRTVFEDATPEVVRDFFWDDEFRPKWDPMLAYFKTLEECPRTGEMLVHWIKKFPFFCSDREYIIGKRIWEAGKTYYCVTKGVPYLGLPLRDKPRRVSLYFSSWAIRAVESLRGDGLMTACEVTLIHYEDMGIPKDVAKLGIRHGMWGTVKKLHSGMRAYQNARKLEASLSRSALMARVASKISLDGYADSLVPVSGEEGNDQSMTGSNSQRDLIDWKWVVVGGTVALAFGLRSGVGKTLLLGAAKRLAHR